MRVLIVEDEPEVAEFVQRVLRDATWAADIVGTAAAARQQLAGVAYDLAVVDVGLPDGDGFALCRSLREAGNHTPILLLTARHAVQDRVRGLDAGADDYLAKPFAVSELLSRCHGCDETPISVTVRRHDQWADLAVASHRPSSFMADTEPSSSEPPSSGLGQRIVRWIADVHSGHFAVAQDAPGHYVATLTMPVAPIDETSHLSASRA